MILYDNTSWVNVVFTKIGTIWPHIHHHFLGLMVYLTVATLVSDYFKIVYEPEFKSIIGGTLAFLLIFRANQAYAWYWEGRTQCSFFFSVLRDFLMLSIVYTHRHMKISAQRQSFLAQLPPVAMLQDIEKRASDLRLHLVRLTIAYAVVLKTHTRIAYDGYCFGKIDGYTKWLVDWDRLRLMQLLKEEEFAMVDKCFLIMDEAARSGGTLDELARQFGRHPRGPPIDWPAEFDVSTDAGCRAHVVVLYLLREIMIGNINDSTNCCPWGIKERFVPSLSKLLGSAHYAAEHINQIIQTQMPLPYACLTKTLLIIFFAGFPCMFVDYNIGWFGSLVIPTIIAMALLGIDAIAMELENPFGDDANDLDLLECIHGLEREAIECLKMCGDDETREKFVWRILPDFVANSSCKPLKAQLVVDDFATPMDVMEGASEVDSAEGSSARSSLLGVQSEESDYGL